jgi:Immunity protein 26
VEMSKWTQSPLNEGNLFLVPLGNGSYSLGLIARLKEETGSVLGFFFNAVHNPVTSVDHLLQQKPQDAIAVMKFGYGALRDNVWKVIGPLSSWKREDWEVTTFSYSNDILKKFEKREYDSNDPFHKVVNIIKVKPEELKGIPKDSTFSPVAVVNELNSVLRNSQRPSIGPLFKQEISTRVQKTSPNVNEGGNVGPQEVFIHLKLDSDTFGEKKEVDTILNLGDRFHQHFGRRSDIKFDGDEIGEGYATMFFYGDDADKMLDEILSEFEGFSFPPNSYATKRYGGIGAQEVKVILGNSQAN